MDWGILGTFVLGSVVKHIGRNKKLNKWIPFINLVAGSVGYGALTGDWNNAINHGAMYTGITTPAHIALKKTVMKRISINGQGI